MQRYLGRSTSDKITRLDEAWDLMEESSLRSRLNDVNQAHA